MGGTTYCVIVASGVLRLFYPCFSLFPGVVLCFLLINNIILVTDKKKKTVINALMSAM